MKYIQGDMLAIDNEANKGEVKHKIIAEKENTFQLLKKNLKIPTTQFIHSTKLTKLEREKELPVDEISDNKAKLLRKLLMRRKSGKMTKLFWFKMLML